MQVKNEAYRKHLEEQGAVPIAPPKEKKTSADDSSDDEEGGDAAAGEARRMTKNEMKQKEKERKVMGPSPVLSRHVPVFLVVILFVCALTTRLMSGI